MLGDARDDPATRALVKHVAVEEVPPTHEEEGLVFEGAVEEGLVLEWGAEEGLVFKGAVEEGLVLEGVVDRVAQGHVGLIEEGLLTCC